MTPDELIKLARDIIAKTPHCFVITINRIGQPNARLMEHFAPEDDLTLWIGTDAVSQKVTHIIENTQVTIADEDPANYAYVMLQGSAQIVQNPDIQRQYWREDWREFFPEGPESTNYVLIKFTPHRLEMMSHAQGIAPSRFGLKPIVLIRQPDDTWAVDESGGVT
jgi:general stress protein 26